MPAAARDRHAKAERERAREREQELLEMFNVVALDVTDEDVEVRESLLGGFAGSSESCRISGP